jgi:hypothetical protein
MKEVVVRISDIINLYFFALKKDDFCS